MSKQSKKSEAELSSGRPPTTVPVKRRFIPRKPDPRFVEGQGIKSVLDWSKGRVEARQRLYLRLDSDVFRWYKAKGHGFHRTINQILRDYMESHQEG